MRRSLIVLALGLLLTGCSRASRNPNPDVRAVYESARAIEAALGVGVPYGDFGTLVRQMSRELILARDRLRFGAAGAPDPHTVKLLDRYGELLGMYSESAKVWQLEIQDKKNDKELPLLAAKYGIPSAVSESTKRAYGMTFTEKYVAFEHIRQTIWSNASKVQEALAADVFGAFVPLEPKRQ